MDEYHKIQTLFERDPATKHKKVIPGAYSDPVFEYLKDCEWNFTEKVDGTNIRVMIHRLPDGSIDIRFGGKTDNSSIPTPLLNKLQDRFFPQRDKLDEMFPSGGCLYGEGYGDKIQKVGKLYLPHQDFVLFDVKVGEYWLRAYDVWDVAEKLNLEIVPLIGVGTLEDMVRMVSEGKLFSRWSNDILPCFLAEGIVARPSLELQTKQGKRVITKLKCKDF